MPTTIGVVYTFMIIGHWHEQTGGFGSLGQVRDLFQNPWLLPAGWVHYLAFDLLVGAWECADAEQRQIRHFLVISFLLLTFLIGPIGFLLYPMPTNLIEALPEERRIAFLLAEVEGFALQRDQLHASDSNWHGDVSARPLSCETAPRSQSSTSKRNPADPGMNCVEQDSVVATARSAMRARRMFSSKSEVLSDANGRKL
jgi:hypothetical protein